MTGRPAIQIEGLDELRRELRRLADTDLKRQMVQTNRRLAREVVDRARPNVPVKTGRLKASLRGTGSLSGAVGRVGSDRGGVGGAAVPYAAAIHWGRRRGGVIAGRPFLRQAAQVIERDVVDRYRRDIDALFEAIR